MRQGRDGAGFPLEPGESLCVAQEALGRDLDRDVAPEAGVTRPVNLPHPSHVDRREDFVRAQAETRA